MKTIKLLSMAVIAVGLASCSSEDEFVSSNKKTAESGNGLIPITLSYTTPSLAGTRAGSAIGNLTDFAPSGSPYDVTVGFIKAGATAGTFSVYGSASGYVWTCEAGKMNRKSSTDIVYFPTDATFGLGAYTVYPTTLLSGITNPFTIPTSTKAVIVKAVTDATNKESVDLSTHNYKYISYPTDQSTDATYTNYDYLLGDCTWSKESGSTFDESNTMSFKHAGAKITIRLRVGTGDGTSTQAVTEDEIKTAKVELLNFNTHASFNIFDINMLMIGMAGIVGLPTTAWTTGETATDAAGTIFNYQDPATIAPTPEGSEAFESIYASKRALLGSHSIGSVVTATPTTGIGDLALVTESGSNFNCATCSVILPPQLLLWGVPGIRITIGTTKAVVYIDKTIITDIDEKFWQTSPNNEYIFTISLTKNAQKELNASGISYNISSWIKSYYKGNATVK